MRNVNGLLNLMKTWGSKRFLNSNLLKISERVADCCDSEMWQWRNTGGLMCEPGLNIFQLHSPNVEHEHAPLYCADGCCSSAFQYRLLTFWMQTMCLLSGLSLRSAKKTTLRKPASTLPRKQLHKKAECCQMWPHQPQLEQVTGEAIPRKLEMCSDGKTITNVSLCEGDDRTEIVGGNRVRTGEWCFKCVDD